MGLQDYYIIFPTFQICLCCFHKFVCNISALFYRFCRFISQHHAEQKNFKVDKNIMKVILLGKVMIIV